MKIPGLVKFIHWGVVVVIVLNSFILEAGDPPHRYLGYTAIALVILRLLYGFKYDSHFTFNLSKLKAFIVSLIKFNPQDYGEQRNPLASYVYVLIWVCVGALALTGWLMGLDAFWGDETIEEIHEIISNILLGLVVAHLIGMLTDFYFHKRKPWLKMLK